MTTEIKPRIVEYPTEDGRPMAETDKHRLLATYVIDSLMVFFANRPDVYISGNNFVFWEEGNPKARISPDAYVVFGPENRPRDSYMAWQESGRLPSVIFEFTSKKTRAEDTHTKLPLYENVLKTPEYFLFDLTGDYLKPRLQGYRLQDGRYVRLELNDNRLHSEQLGLDLVQQGESLRLYDPIRAEFFPDLLERAHRMEEAERIANMEANRVVAAETEIERLRAEIAALKAEKQ